MAQTINTLTAIQVWLCEKSGVENMIVPQGDVGSTRLIQHLYNRYTVSHTKVVRGPWPKAQIQVPSCFMDKG